MTKSSVIWVCSMAVVQHLSGWKVADNWVAGGPIGQHVDQDRKYICAFKARGRWGKDWQS